MITVKFTCGRCNCVDTTVAVRFRRPDEDILIWMEEVKERIAAAHRDQSPRCRTTKMKHAMIPLPPKPILKTDPEIGIGMDPNG
jgi:hypothetical protein